MTMPTDKTAQKQRGKPFKPGQSGNPAGKPLGSKNKIAEHFIEAITADFEQHGKDVIEKVRTGKPDAYLKLVADLVPKDFNHKASLVLAPDIEIRIVDPRAKWCVNRDQPG